MDTLNGPTGDEPTTEIIEGKTPLETIIEAIENPETIGDDEGDDHMLRFLLDNIAHDPNCSELPIEFQGSDQSEYARFLELYSRRNGQNPLVDALVVYDLEHRDLRDPEGIICNSTKGCAQMLYRAIKIARSLRNQGEEDGKIQAAIDQISLKKMGDMVYVTGVLNEHGPRGDLMLRESMAEVAASRIKQLPRGDEKYHGYAIIGQYAWHLCMEITHEGQRGLELLNFINLASPELVEEVFIHLHWKEELADARVKGLREFYKSVLLDGDESATLERLTDCPTFQDVYERFKKGPHGRAVRKEHREWKRGEKEIGAKTRADQREENPKTEAILDGLRNGLGQCTVSAERLVEPTTSNIWWEIGFPNSWKVISHDGELTSLHYLDDLIEIKIDNAIRKSPRTNRQYRRPSKKLLGKLDRVKKIWANVRPGLVADIKRAFNERRGEIAQAILDRELALDPSDGESEIAAKVKWIGEHYVETIELMRKHEITSDQCAYFTEVFEARLNALRERREILTREEAERVRAEKYEVADASYRETIAEIEKERAEALASDGYSEEMEMEHIERMEEAKINYLTAIFENGTGLDLDRTDAVAMRRDEDSIASVRISAGMGLQLQLQQVSTLKQAMRIAKDRMFLEMGEELDEMRRRTTMSDFTVPHEVGYIVDYRLGSGDGALYSATLQERYTPNIARIVDKVPEEYKRVVEDNLRVVLEKSFVDGMAHRLATNYGTSVLDQAEEERLKTFVSAFTTFTETARMVTGRNFENKDTGLTYSIQLIRLIADAEILMDMMEEAGADNEPDSELMTLTNELEGLKALLKKLRRGSLTEEKSPRIFDIISSRQVDSIKNMCKQLFREARMVGFPGRQPESNL